MCGALVDQAHVPAWSSIDRTGIGFLDRLTPPRTLGDRNGCVVASECLINDTAPGSRFRSDGGEDRRPCDTSFDGDVLDRCREIALVGKERVEKRRRSTLAGIAHVRIVVRYKRRLTPLTHRIILEIYSIR